MLFRSVNTDSVGMFALTVDGQGQYWRQTRVKLLIKTLIKGPITAVSTVKPEPLEASRLCATVSRNGPSLRDA